VQPKRQILVDATNGNVTAAAKKLGISRRTLHRKINEMNAAKAEGSRQAVAGVDLSAVALAEEDDSGPF